MSSTLDETGAKTWPADVIHVNEDGWVLINRGQRAGVFPGLKLLVVGPGIRDLRNLFAGQSDDTGERAADQPTVLRTRRTYEQLEVVYVEADCAVAIATRTPPVRRPSFYRGPEGELLVWVPLPEGYTYPLPGASAADAGTESSDGDQDAVEQEASIDAQLSEGSQSADEDQETPDTPPGNSEQDDERWEEALPLNGVAVGDLVVPAIPASTAPGEPGATSTAGAPAPAMTGAESQANPFELGTTYDWLKPGQ